MHFWRANKQTRDPRYGPDRVNGGVPIPKPRLQCKVKWVVCLAGRVNATDPDLLQLVFTMPSLLESDQLVLSAVPSRHMQPRIWLPEGANCSRVLPLSDLGERIV